MAAWPVYIVVDDPVGLSVTVAMDDARHIPAGLGGEVAAAVMDGEGVHSIRRAYATSAVRVRLHQQAFRERVLEAYQRQCAFCRLKHDELLDAAHIVPDSEPGGEPVVRNGLALCSLHHSTFDRHFIGLRPDYVLEVRPDILIERDGPTLAHAIQALHGREIILPCVRIPSGFFSGTTVSGQPFD